MNSANTIAFSEMQQGSFMNMNPYPFEARRAGGAYYTVTELAVDTDISDTLEFVISTNFMSAETTSRQLPILE